MSIFSELKRRKVFRVGAAYLVVAWLVIQVADILAPQLRLPDWAPRFVTLVVLLGFPLALVLAWIFDVTPEGIRRDATPFGNKAAVAVGVVMVAVIGGWTWTRWRGADGAEPRERSVAVLPFLNMSGDPNQEYFSDGISEEILNVLARTPNLRVAARTSSFAFKGQNVEVPEIAETLHVGMVLEGSVRQQGEEVRITAQLIDAAGFHVWSDTYDRDLRNIFAVQDEIAAAIAKELQVRVAGGAARPDSAAPVDPRAYDLYLKGLALWQTRSAENLLAAVDTLERAVRIEPDFARAWAGLALVYAVIPDYTGRVSFADAHRLGQDAGETALALDPSLPEAFAALGSIAAASRRQASALRLLHRATVLNPSLATAWQWMGALLTFTGRLDEGLDALERARTLDPRSDIVADNFAFSLLAAERYQDVIAVCRETLSRNAESGNYLCRSDDLLARLGAFGPSGAREALLAWGVRAGMVRQAEAVADALEGRGDVRAVARALASAPIRGTSDPEAGVLFTAGETPSLLVLLGEPDLAISYLERLAAREGSSPEWAILPPPLDPVRCDARVVAIMKRGGAVDPRAGKVCGRGADPSGHGHAPASNGV